MGLMSVHLIFILFYCNVLHHIFDPLVTALHLIEQPTYKAQYIIELMTSLSVQCTQFFYAGIIAGPRYAAGYSIEHRWLGICKLPTVKAQKSSYQEQGIRQYHQVPYRVGSYCVLCRILP